VDWHQRFAEFVARKEDEARRARLWRFTTSLEQPFHAAVRLENDWTGNLFDGAFYASPVEGDVPATSLVFVQSRDGNTGAKDPSSLGGGETDKHLIYEGLSRVAADAVLAGAETIRGGHIVFSTWLPEVVALRTALGLPRHPIQVIATLRGLDFDQALILNVPDLRVVMLTTVDYVSAMHHALVPRPWITPIVLEEPGNLREAFRQLRALGINRISCVGGRTLARQLIDRGLVDDLYLTTSPKKGGEPNTPMYPKPLNGELVVRKLGTGAEEGVVFEHLRLIASSTSV
jgi:riboflavin biosynthesis pyrimidine reductase